jgi:hypothetical protein
VFDVPENISGPGKIISLTVFEALELAQALMRKVDQATTSQRGWAVPEHFQQLGAPEVE